MCFSNADPGPDPNTSLPPRFRRRCVKAGRLLTHRLCPELGRGTEGPAFPVRRDGDPHSQRRKMSREPWGSGSDAFAVPLPTPSSHTEASLREPRQVGCSDRDLVGEAPSPRPDHPRRGQRRPGLSAAGRDRAAEPGSAQVREARVAPVATRSPARGPRFPRSLSPGPESKTGGASWEGAPGPPERRAPHPALSRPALRPPPPDTGWGSGVGGALPLPRKKAPSPRGALGTGHLAAGAPAG